MQKADYLSEGDTVRWTLKLATGEPYYLHWPRPQFGPAMGIKRDIPVDEVKRDLHHFVGKQFPLWIEYLPATGEVDYAAVNQAMADFSNRLRNNG